MLKRDGDEIVGIAQHDHLAPEDIIEGADWGFMDSSRPSKGEDLIGGMI